MKIDIIDNYGELNKYRKLWQEVSNRHQGTLHPFLDFDWVSIYSKYFLTKKDLRIIICSNDNTTAILPCCYSYKGYKQLSSLGKGLTDYGDIVVDGQHCLGIQDIFMNTKADCLSFINVREDSPLLSMPYLSNFKENNKHYRVVIEKSVVSPYISLEGQQWDSYWMSLTGNLRSNIRRKTKRLSSKGELSFGYCADTNELKKLLPIFYSQHITRRKYLGQSKSIFLNNTVRMFFDELSQSLFGQSKLLLFYLKLDDTIISMVYCFILEKKVYYYIPTFDVEYSVYSPGYIMVYNLIRFCVMNGMKEVDFMIGDELYKLGWNARLRNTSNIHFFKKNILGKIAFMDSKVQSGCRWLKDGLVHSKLKNIKRMVLKGLYRVGW